MPDGPYRETNEIERIFRQEYGSLIASLVRRFGEIDIAEEGPGSAASWSERPSGNFFSESVGSG
jgi:hypothetical protein